MLDVSFNSLEKTSSFSFNEKGLTAVVIQNYSTNPITIVTSNVRREIPASTRAGSTVVPRLPFEISNNGNVFDLKFDIEISGTGHVIVDYMIKCKK